MAPQISYVCPSASSFRQHFYGSGGPIETPTPSPRKNKNKRKRAPPLPHPVPLTGRPPSSNIVVTAASFSPKLPSKEKKNTEPFHSTFIFRSGIIPEEVASPGTPFSVDSFVLRYKSPSPPPSPPKAQPYHPASHKTDAPQKTGSSSSSFGGWGFWIGLFMFISFVGPFVTVLILHHIWLLCVGFGKYFGLLNDLKWDDNVDVYWKEVPADPQVEREWKRRLKGRNEPGDTTPERD